MQLKLRYLPYIISKGSFRIISCIVKKKIIIVNFSRDKKKLLGSKVLKIDFDRAERHD